MPETIAEMRRACDRIFCFNADDPFSGSPSSRPEHLPAAQEVDGFFIWSRELLRRLENEGVSPVEYLPFAWDPDVFPEAPLSPDPEHDVIFIGNWDRHRERWLEPVARQFDLKIWGTSYWETRTRRGSPLRKCWQGGKLVGPDAAEEMSNAKICLNVLREQNLPDGTNMRTFEVPGVGGFLLATRTDGAREIFPEENAGAYFGDVDELVQKIEYYLAHDRERRSIAQQAHRIARRNTYVERARQILNL